MEQSTSVSHFFVSIGFFCLSICGGLLLITKAGCDIKLMQFIGDPIKSATIVTAIGAVFLTPTILIKPRGEKQYSLKTTFKNMKKKDYSIFLTGPFGNIQTIIAIFIASNIGFSLYFICVVFGQIISSFIIDSYGLLWRDKKQFSFINKLAIPMILSAICIFQINDYMEHESNVNLNISIPIFILYSIIAVIAGVLGVLCTVLNERLDEGFLGSPYRAQVFSYYIDVISGCILILMTHFIPSQPFSINTRSTPKWWYFIGGVMGISYLISLICVEHIGFSATYIGVITGNLTMSLIFDQFGVFGIDKQDITWNRMLGTALLLLSCILINVDKVNKLKQTEKSQSMIEGSIKLDQIQLIQS